MKRIAALLLTTLPFAAFAENPSVIPVYSCRADGGRAFSLRAYHIRGQDGVSRLGLQEAEDGPGGAKFFTYELADCAAGASNDSLCFRSTEYGRPTNRARIVIAKSAVRAALDGERKSLRYVRIAGSSSAAVSCRFWYK